MGKYESLVCAYVEKERSNNKVFSVFSIVLFLSGHLPAVLIFVEGFWDIVFPCSKSH